MGKRRGRQYIFWVDLECTGSGDNEDVIELGAVITDRDLNELDSRQYVFPTTQDKLDGMAPVVVSMHTKNDLLDEVRAATPEERNEALELADEELAAWIRSFCGGDHMVIAGSGVSHYDRKYIKRDFPALNDRVTYKHLDIGAISMGMEYAGIEWSKDFYTKTHRALDDARQHVREFQRYVNWCREAVRNGNDFQL